MPIPSSDPIVVAPTNMPFNSDESLDLDALSRNVDKFCETALSGFVVGSYGGEEFHMGEPEKVLSIKTVVEAHAGRKFVIAGIDALSPTEAVRLSNLYAEAGADMVRVRIPPAAGKGNAAPIQDYFEQVTSKSPIPVVIIHQPKTPMGVDVTPAEVRDITSFENVFAYIMSLNYRYECRISSFVSDAVKFWTCNGSLLMPGGMIGAVGACLLFGNWGPHIARDIIQACLDGRYAEARELQERINRIDFLGMSWGVGVQKTGLSLLGYEGTMPRKPNLPLSDTQISEVKDALIEARILNFDGTPAPQI
ncbi:MAG: dihydrodipicolinate synthase family protein [SAR202 cluster bacterium]|jgi:dihydrodipicolinate synthase/N-acetylneuraminate lyase|nr:MAG: dihydrodipicolinate synthase family protein [SAR202 cluster bacterium]MQG90159.1 dihydrodipicolinate synthase family protein [SAR202 cluster bacterium]